MPQKEARSPRQAAVARLREYTPHPTRTNVIRHWHLDEIDKEDASVAMVHISITASGQVSCKGLGLDPVHAEIILEELNSARQKLTEYLAQYAANSNVIQLREAS
jgi:hypothetical protein